MKQLDTATGKLKEKKEFVTVWLKENPDKDLKMFYCPKCRNPIMQYRGDVSMVIPGLSPSKLPLQVMCKNLRCRTVYQFVSFVKEEI